MSDNVYPSTGNGSGRSRFPISGRTIGILVMIAGAAAFFYSQLRFPDQVLCLGGSTLVVFAGLAIILADRRAGAASTPAQPEGQDVIRQSQPALKRQIPRGLREQAQRQGKLPSASITAAAARPAESPIEQIPAVQPEKLPGADSSLLGQVIALLNEQGAQVAIETQRDDASGSRGILQVQSSSGLPFRVMVLEGGDPVDVADVRALFALITSSGSSGGYLVSTAPFTQQAYDWAGARHIHLVREDELGEMSI